jgi:glycosyltransferase involved in cell wall biosynthesis
LGLTAQTKKLVENLQLLTAAPLILLPVRITRRKNIELAIRAVAELKKNFSNVMLVVTGPPGPHNIANQEYFETLKELRDQISLKGQVHFLAELSSDYFPEELIFGLYRLADLLLLPSIEEGFGLPVIEASQTRLPIFCSDIEPLRELGKDEAEYFSPQATPEEIGAKIGKYLQESNSYRIRKRLHSHEWNRVYENMIAPLLREAGGVSQ